jgi:hypothetical protein
VDHPCLQFKEDNGRLTEFGTLYKLCAIALLPIFLNMIKSYLEDRVFDIGVGHYSRNFARSSFITLTLCTLSTRRASYATDMAIYSSSKSPALAPATAVLSRDAFQLAVVAFFLELLLLQIRTKPSLSQKSALHHYRPWPLKIR